MSANNYLRISKKDGKFILYDLDVDSDSGFIEGTFNTFKEARDKANSILSGDDFLNIVEYGLKIDENCYE